MSGLLCNSCGHLNEAAARFCSSCGQRLENGGDIGDLVDQDTDMVEVLQKAIADPAPVLVVERGHRAGTTYLLENDAITLGRHPEADIFLDDVTVSRRHAHLERATDGWVVTDDGSLNGTYLNRSRIDGSAVVRNGDHLQIGKFRLVFIEQDGLE